MMPFGLELPRIRPRGVILPGIMPFGMVLPRMTPLGHRVLEAETSEAGQEPQRSAPARPIAPDATQRIKSFVIHLDLLAVHRRARTFRQSGNLHCGWTRMLR
jgi:hypothetical protein